MILIPAAGEGSRFADAGYEGPKHLLPLGGKPMIDWVISNVSPLDPDGRVLVATTDMVGRTRGATETISRAADRTVGYEDPLVVANCDQLIKLPEEFDRYSYGYGIVFTFWSANPAHSYVITDETDRILEIAEKKVISTRAVSGVYWFMYAGGFLKACREVKGQGELYVSKALKLMLDNYDLYAVDVPTAILGTPEDFQRFEVALSCAS